MGQPSDPVANLGQVLGRFRPPLIRPGRSPGDVDSFGVGPWFDELPIAGDDLGVVPEPIPPPPVPPTQPEPEPGSFSGGFSGEALLVAENSGLVAPGSPPADSQFTEVGAVDLTEHLESGWNLIYRMVGDQFESEIETIPSGALPKWVRRLYNARVQLQSADRRVDKLDLSVRPGWRTFTLFYLLDAEHEMTFKADVKYLSDPRVAVGFHLAIALSFVTDGRPAPYQPPSTSSSPQTAVIQPEHVNGSVWLRSVQLRLMAPRVTVSKNDLLSEIIDFFRKGSFAQEVHRRLAGMSSDLMAASGFLIAGLKHAMIEAELSGISTNDVMPWYDTNSHRLLLRLRQPSPVLV